MEYYSAIKRMESCLCSHMNRPRDYRPWQLIWYRIHLQCRRLLFNSWVGKFPWRRDKLSTPVFLGFPGGSDGEESGCNMGDLGSIPGLGRCPGGGHGNPLQYPWLENSHGQRSLVGYSLWDCKESDMTKRLSILGRWGTKGKNWVLYSGWVRGITAQIYLGQNESN